MAADKVLVSTEELTAAAGQFKGYFQEMQAAYMKMSDAVKTLDGTWDGEASEQFKVNFDDMFKNLSQTEGKMNDAIDEMLKSAQLFEEVEKALQNHMAGLEEGTSPFA